MKSNTKRFLLMMSLSLCFLCTACGGSAENVKNVKSSAIHPQDDPGEGLGDDFTERNEDTGNEDAVKEDTVNECSLYEGLWLSEITDEYDYLEFDADGNWQLYYCGSVMDEGYLWYDVELDTTFVYSYLGSAIEGNPAVLDGEQLYITDLGHFSLIVSDDDPHDDDDPNEDDDPNDNNNNGNGYYNWNSELHQKNVSEFEGVWYYDEDLSATTYLIIDDSGNWSYYQRTSGDAEGTEMDYGTFSYSTNEDSVYYADSAVYDDLSILVLEFDEDILIWGDEGAYYRME